jgi:hypothetical protein
MYSDDKVANRRGFGGWEIAHGAVSRCPPISLDTMVARTENYTYAANVWALSIVRGPFSVAAKPVTIRKFTIAVPRWHEEG